MDRSEFITDTTDPRSAFERSLDELCANDIAAPGEKQPLRAGQIAFQIFRWGLLFLFAGISAVCIGSILSESASYFRADNLYSDLAEQFESDEFAAGVQSEIPALPIGTAGAVIPTFEQRLSGDLPEQPETATGGAVARAKVAHLKELNPDAVGWLIVDGVGISLPVVQGEDNEHYLNYAFDGTENWAGSLFFDYTNSPTVTENTNLVVYGHNLEGGQMFSNLTKFLEEDFFYANRYITLYSDEGIFTYEIFAVFKASTTDNYYHTHFSDEREFCDFMYDMKYDSIFPVEGVEFTEQDRMITLSTCTNENKHERYVVQGKLIGHEE